MTTAFGLVGVALAAALAAALIAPVRIALEWDGDGPPPRARIEARWLFGVWRLDGTRSSARRPRRPRAPRPSRPDDSSSGRAGRRFRAALLARGVVPRLVRLIVDLIRLLPPRVVEGRMTVGLDDPVSTGMLYGAACACGALAPPGAWRVRVEPEFAGPSFTARGRAEWVLRPGRVLWPIGTFLCPPPTWRAAWAALRA